MHSKSDFLIQYHFFHPSFKISCLMKCSELDKPFGIRCIRHAFLNKDFLRFIKGYKIFQHIFCTKKIELLLFKKKKENLLIYLNYLKFTEMCPEFGKTMVY